MVTALVFLAAVGSTLAVLRHLGGQVRPGSEDMVDRSGVYQAMGTLSTPSIEWVALPFGQHYWTEPALSAGLKLTHVATSWTWRGRQQPSPWLQATRETREASIAPCCYLNELAVYADPASEYAVVETGTEKVACAARGGGGDIRVTCASPGGQLVLRENNWAGWNATINGRAAPLDPGPQLAVEVPEGTVEVRFHYIPADAVAGAALTAAGLLLILVLWVQAGRRARRS